MPDVYEEFRLRPPTEEEKELGKHLARKLQLLEREKNKVLINDFLFYIDLDLDESYIDSKIESFLDERSKDNVG
jgi:hypothetical protein